MRLAVILARAGSKGIKNKNLALLGDKPLLFYTIQAAKNASCIDKVVVSSDGDNILEYAKSQGAVPLRRQEIFANDDSLSHDALAHVIEQVSINDYISDVFLLQPTSPFRTADDIMKAYQLYKENEYLSLISVVVCDNKILKAFMLDENGNLEGIANNIYPFMPRQKLPQTFMSNGAIYIVNAINFLQTRSFISSKTGYYCMSEESSFDIDTPKDLKEANKILRLLQNPS